MQKRSVIPMLGVLGIHQLALAAAVANGGFVWFLYFLLLLIVAVITISGVVLARRIR